MSRIRFVLAHLRYYLTASSGKGHSIHSPFVFEFITKLLNDSVDYPDYREIESLRKQLLRRRDRIHVRDFGTGGRRDPLRSVRSIARRSLKPRKYAQLLYRMARHFQPRTVLELGTSLGVTTSYLARAVPEGRVTTLEGAQEAADIARHLFRTQGLQNVQVVEGNFDETLSEVLHGTGKLDFIFLDGNHRREATERYFIQILPQLHEGSVLVVDDIHWSREMEDAWKTVVAHRSVTCSLDLHAFGILFFRKEFREKQHFTIRF